MSYMNLQGAIFAMLNHKGYFDLYDATGQKLEMQVSTMRVTQNAGEFDKIVIIAPVNVVKTKEEIQNLLTKWKK